jgi:hypothetical protein
VRVILCGANPGVQLFEDGTVTAFASVWVVDWSERGSGTAIVLWHGGVVRVLAEDPALGGWLERAFVRHFPEVDGLPWPEPVPERVAVEVRLDLAEGLSARAGDVRVSMSGVLDRREYQTDAFMLDGVAHGLRLVLAPAMSATIEIAGRTLPGAVTRGGTTDRPTSSAFLTAAEVWLRG